MSASRLAVSFALLAAACAWRCPAASAFGLLPQQVKEVVENSEKKPPRNPGTPPVPGPGQPPTPSTAPVPGRPPIPPPAPSTAPAPGQPPAPPAATPPAIVPKASETGAAVSWEQACVNEIGIFCNEVRDDIKKARLCLKRHKSQLLKPCRKALNNPQ